jgi:hypothetical protein
MWNTGSSDGQRLRASGAAAVVRVRVRPVLHVHGRVRAGAVMNDTDDFIVWFAATFLAFIVFAVILTLFIEIGE